MGLARENVQPNIINRRISSLSSLYVYSSPAELRLSLIVPNPAHVQFLPRNAADLVDVTQALSPA